MRFRHLTSAVAQILLNASSGAILQAKDYLLVGNAYKPSILNLSDGTFERFANYQSYNFDTNSDKVVLLYWSSGYKVSVYDHSGNELSQFSVSGQLPTAIRMTDTKIFISDPQDDVSGTNSGAIYVYDHDGSNETKITFSGSTNDYSGNAMDNIAVGSGKIAIGSTPYPNNSYKGKVDLMDEDGSNVITIYPALSNQSQFGSTVNFHNDKLYISAAGPNAQKVYEYDLSGNLLRTFDSPLGGNLQFGTDVSFYGSKMAVSAPTSTRCYIYDLESASQEYVQATYVGHHTKQTSNSNIGFGRSLELTSDSLFVGAPVETNNGVSNSGLIFQFDHSGEFVTKYDVTDIDHLTNSQQNTQIGLNLKRVPGAYPMKMFVSEGYKAYADDQKIYVMDIDGENLIELSAPEGLSQPSSSRYADNIEVSGTNLVAIDPHGNTAYVYDLISTGEPTSFSLDSTISESATDNFVLEGNRLIVNRNPYGTPGRILVYNITNGNLDASFANSDNAGFMRMDVGNDKIVATSGYGDTRKIYVYDIDDTTGSSEVIITPPAPSNTSQTCNVVVGNGKIAYADYDDDNTFYIYNLDGSNEVVVDVSSASLAGYSNFGQSGQWRVGDWTMAIGNERIVLGTNFTGVFIISDLDGSNLAGINMSDLGYSGDATAGFAAQNEGQIYVVNSKIMIAATNGRTSGNESDGIVYTFDLDGSNPNQIISPRGTGSGYRFGKDIAANDPTGLAKFANLPAVISNISSVYTLTEGQDTVITGTAVDPEGDAITWSFEEVTTGSNYIVVGSRFDDDNGTNSGSIYVYDSTDLSAAPIKLTAFDGAGGDQYGDQFGTSVAVTSDIIVVGAHRNADAGYNAGAIYVYDLSDLSAQPTKLTAFDANGNEQFGQYVAASSDLIVVGAPVDDDTGDNSGSVYVYDANYLSAQPTKLTAFDGAGDDRFGQAVAVTSDKVIVGSPFDDDNNASGSGSVYVYDANDLSAQPTKLTASDADANDQFGSAVAVSSNHIVIGARYNDDDGMNSGSVYVYDANNLSAEPTKLTAYDAAEHDSFGSALAVTENNIFVGSYQDDDNGSGSGSVYVYDANDLSAQPTKLTAFDGATEDYFGYSIASTSDKIVIGAYQDNGQPGASYIYDANNLTAIPTKLTPADGAGNDNFGYSVSAISAVSALNDVTVTQSDNVFTITPGTTDSNFTLRFKVTDAAGNVTTKTSTFTYDYVNKAPIVSGIVSQYNLTQGQDTVITASATDPEGDSITWSFEEVKSSLFFAADDYMNVYDPSTLQLLHSLGPFQSHLGSQIGSMAVGGGKYAVGDGVQTNSQILVYDINDLTATPTTLTDSSDNGFGQSIALSDDKLYVGMWKSNNRAGGVLVYDLNDLSASPTEITSPYPYASQGRFGDDNLEVVGNKVFIPQQRGQNGEGVIYVYDNDNLSAAPIEVRAPGSDSFNGDGFGWEGRFAVSDTHLIVGQIYGGSPTHSGLVHIYDINDLSAAPKTIQPFDATTNGYFGYTVEISNDYIVVGARNNDTAVESFYTYNTSDISVAGTTYNTTVTKIVSPESAGERFGKSIRIIENQIFVSLEMGDTNGTNTGSVYVYDATDLTATPQEIVGSRDYASLGTSIMVYKAPSGFNGVTVTQSDNVFTITPGTADANFQLRITATDSNGNATSVTSTFGLNYVNQAPVISNVDAAYTLTQGQDTVITASATDAEGDAITWSFEAIGKLRAAIPAGNQNPKVYYYTDLLNSSYIEILPPADAGEQFGLFPGSRSTVFLTEDKLYVGDLSYAAPWQTNQNGDVGAVFIYDLNDLNSDPVKVEGLQPLETNRSTSFGGHIEVTDNYLIVGAMNASFEEGAPGRGGAVVIYDLNDLSQPYKVINSENGVTFDNYGSTLLVHSNKLVIGYRGFDPGNNDNYGRVDVYNLDNLNAAPTIIQGPEYYGGFGHSIYYAGNDKAIVSNLYGTPYNDSNAVRNSYILDLNNLSAPLVEFQRPVGNTTYSFASRIAYHEGTNQLFVSNPDDGVYVYNANDLSAPIKHMEAGTDIGAHGITVVGDTVSLSANIDSEKAGSIYVYDITDLDASPTILSNPDPVTNDYWGTTFSALLGSADLSGVTVTQSDNVFTITPGTSDANFQLRITATDTAGNATSVTSTFGLNYINQAPVISNVDAAYTLTQGQDTVITAAATDPEGDAITWSFEEVMSGSRYIAVTADADDDVETNSGSVYVYDSTNLSAQPTKLVNPEPGSNDRFGYSVSISQNKLVVGAAHDASPDAYSGSVYVYDLTDLSAEPTKIEAGGPNDRFGNSVATNSNYIFVTSPNDDDAADNAGAVYVYDINDLSATPTKLTPDDSVSGGVGVDGYSASIDANDNYMVVGAYDDSSSNGAAYVYDVNNLGATPTKLTQVGSTMMGTVVRVFDDVIVVGSERTNSNAGEVYVYDANNLGAGPTVLEANDGISGMRMFGSAIEVNDDYIFVGAFAGPNEAFYRFDRSDLSAAPVKVNKEIGDVTDGPQSGLGSSMRLIDNSLFVGSVTGKNNGINTGSISVYDVTDLSSSPTIIFPYDGDGSERFGNRLAVSSLPSALNGVTVTQSDNVFTITPGTADSNFTLRITATDSNGNATSVTSTFDLNYVNQAPAVSGIDAAYTLTQGQDTVITASATDPEGDSITWSFEEVMTGSKYVVVGAHTDNDNGDKSGSVYVYDGNDLTAQPTKLTAFDGAAADFFGRSVAITGNKIVVSADNDDDDGDRSGSVYVFDTNDLSAQPTKLTAYDAAAYDTFGRSVSAINDKIVVSAVYGNGTKGAVYVYDANDLSAQPTKLTAYDGVNYDSFGVDAAITANKIVVGAHHDDDNGSSSGSVYVFDMNDLSAQPTKLTAFDGAANDYFGNSVAASDDRIVVGAWNNDEIANNAGAVYVYDANDLSAQPTKLTAFNAEMNDYFGRNVHVSTNYIFVCGLNNTRGVYVYDANTYSYITNLAPDGLVFNDYVGMSISTNGDNVFIGAYLDDDNGSNAGAVYVYDANDLSAQPTKLTAYDGSGMENFGRSIASNVLASSLNGTTVSQSDNVFTVTPGQQDATFQLTFKATDTAGNLTSTTSDFTLDYVNQAPAVSGIESSYTLTQGQDTVITASATDAEGDAITWSYEAVSTGTSYVVISADGNRSDLGRSESVYVYDPTDLTQPVYTLENPNGVGVDDYFGNSIATTGDKIIVSAHEADDVASNAGAVYVYDANDLNTAPTKLTAFDYAVNDRFGMSVAATANKIVVGAPYDDDNGNNSGSIYVFDTNDLSAQPTKLTAFDGAENDTFGSVIAATEDKIFVSATNDDDNGADSGSIYVFDTNDLSAQPTKLTPFDGAASNYLGGELSTGNGKIVITAISGYTGPAGNNSAKAYVYNEEDLSYVGTITPPDFVFDGMASYQSFSINSVTTTENHILIGSQGYDSGRGIVLVYDTNTLNYVQSITRNSSNAYWASSMHVFDGKLYTGAYDQDVNDNGIHDKAGSVFVYDASDFSFIEQITEAQPEADRFFGRSIVSYSPSAALNGTTVSQSDNVFTVTPGQQDATFTLAFKATDTAGNVTSVSSDFTLNYINQAPSVTGIDSSYLLDAGGSAEVITAAATDPEGDAIAWSFEEVISGSNYVVVGAMGDDSNAGSVYVYDANDLSAQPTKLTAFDGAAVDLFGMSVATTSDKIIVGSSLDDDNGTSSGSVYLYDLNDLSAQPTKLTAYDSSENDKFGYKVAATSDKIFITAIADNGTDSGFVYVYNANDLSAQPTKLTPFDGAANDYFGSSISVASNSIFIGAPYDDDNGTNSGSVYVYDANDLSAQPTKITAFDGTAGNLFGTNMDTFGDKVVITSSHENDGTGSVYVYDANNLSAQPTKLTAFDGAATDYFGNAVAASDDKIVVGAYYDDDNGDNSGSVYVYDANDLSAQPTKLTAFDGAAGDGFGMSVDIINDKIFVGAWADGDNGPNSGSVYVYDANDLSAQPTKLTAFDGAANDYFGRSLSISPTSSSLNGTTVTQSDNVFTVTPGSEATSFSIRFTATDTAGNVTSTTSDFTVESAPEPQMGDLFIGSDGYSTGDFNNESEVDAWTNTGNASFLAHRSDEGGHMQMGWGTDNQIGAYIELDVVPNTEYTISFSGTATSGAPVGNVNYRDAYVNVRVVDSEPVGTNAAALILQTTPSTTGGTYPNGSTASNGWQPQTSKSGYQTLSGTITPHGSKLTIQILNVDKVVQYFDDFSVTGLVPV